MSNCFVSYERVRSSYLLMPLSVQRFVVKDVLILFQIFLALGHCHLIE